MVITQRQIPAETQLLVIDFVGQLEEEEPQSRKSTLITCTAVNKTWYHRSIQYLWCSVALFYYEQAFQESSVARATSRTLDLLSIILSNSELAKSIKSFSLKLTVHEYTRAFDGNPALLTLSTFFPMVPEFQLTTGGHSLDDGEVCVETLRDPDHTLSQVIYPFLRAPVLTTLCLSGQNIPIDLLEDTPNLLHAKFSFINDVSMPKVWRGLHESALSAFRLKTTTFHWHTLEHNIDYDQAS